MRKICLLLAIMLQCALSSVMAQNGYIRGRVVDIFGEPFGGACIREKNTTNAVAAGINGEFAISVKPGTMLSVTFIGYEYVEVPASQDMVVCMKVEPCEFYNLFQFLDRPFGILYTPRISKDEALKRLNASEHFFAMETPKAFAVSDNDISVMRNDMTCYAMDKAHFDKIKGKVHKNPEMVATFKDDKLVQCDYFFTYEKVSVAKDAYNQLVSELKKKAVETEKESSNEFLAVVIHDGERINFMVTYFDNLGRGMLGVTVDY